MATASGSCWWRVGRNELPSFVPPTMRPKLDGGVIVVSGSAAGTCYVMFGAERADFPANEVDLQAFAVAVYPDGQTSGLAMVHHGGTVSRSICLPSDYQAIVSSSAPNGYYYENPPEKRLSGSLESLSVRQRSAFEHIVAYVSGSGAGA
jgi:hypothetical protein